MKQILIVSETGLEKKQITSLLDELSFDDIQVHQVKDFEQAENELFEKQITLIILDWEIEGAEDFIQAIKSDEMFRLLPVLVIIPEADSGQTKDVFLCGADNCIARSECAELLYYKLRPLLINNVLNSELVGKLSILQEQAIHDFILQDIIKKYVPQELYKQADVYAHEQKTLIPEQELELTIVFADIKDFTRISQHLEPSEVIRNLNNVFEIATRHVYQTNGDVDKFIGDAFFAVFGDASDAVKACVKIQDEVAKLNEKRKKDKLEPIQFRFGIHTGPIIRGNVGGNERFDNTMIGDTVNTASRLESVCEPGEILISDLTREKAGLKIPKERQIKKKLRGREGEETLYYVYEFLKGKA